MIHRRFWNDCRTFDLSNVIRHKVCLVDRGTQSFSDAESFVATGTNLNIFLP